LQEWLERKQFFDMVNVGVEKEAKRIEYFNSEDDAFNFLRSMLASGYPVEVHLNTILLP